MLQMSTQRFSLVPSTGSSTRSGHSQTPPCAPCFWPKLLSYFQSLRLAEDHICISCPTASIITQCLPGAYQNTFGSRKSRAVEVITGLPSYLVKVFPPSVLYAILCIWTSPQGDDLADV